MKNNLKKNALTKDYFILCIYKNILKIWHVLWKVKWESDKWVSFGAYGQIWKHIDTCTQAIR